MTATVFVPTGNPVSRFVAALAAVGVAASALWFSGLAAPRLAVVSAATATAAVDAAPRRVLTLRLRNEGPLPVEVRGFRARDGRVSIGSARSGAVRLGGGEAATFEVDHLVDCRPGLQPPVGRLEVVVRTPLGIERARGLGGLDLLSEACPPSSTAEPAGSGPGRPPRPGSSPPPAGPGSPRSGPGPA